MFNKYAHHVKEVAKTLKKRYKDFAHHNKKNPLNELLFILCSVKTTDSNYKSTYASLIKSFPSHQLLADAPVGAISKAIFRGGLYRQKATTIKKLLESINNIFGKPSLSPIKRMSSEDCENFLLSLPGVGKKVARCVMMYSLGYEVFPVDTHCWRICHRLGWVRPRKQMDYCSQGYMDIIQDKIPSGLRFSLHVNMVSLGREICTALRPKCEKCPIEKYCPKIGAKQDFF